MIDPIRPIKWAVGQGEDYMEIEDTVDSTVKMMDYVENVQLEFSAYILPDVIKCFQTIHERMAKKGEPIAEPEQSFPPNHIFDLVGWAIEKQITIEVSAQGHPEGPRPVNPFCFRAKWYGFQCVSEVSILHAIAELKKIWEKNR